MAPSVGARLHAPGTGPSLQLLARSCLPQFPSCCCRGIGEQLPRHVSPVAWCALTAEQQFRCEPDATLCPRPCSCWGGRGCLLLSSFIALRLQAMQGGVLTIFPLLR